MKPYTLADFYTEAALENYPEWASDMILRHPYVEDFRPRWEQVVGLNLAFCYPNLRCGLFDEPGTGKTLPSQAFALWHAGMGNRVVAVMPRVLMRQYQTSFFTTFENFHKYATCEIYYGTTKQRSAQAQRWKDYGAPDIVITTYDAIRAEFAVFAALDFKAIVLDECRVLSNDESKTAIAIRRFMGKNGQKYGMALNGTPLSNNLMQAYGYIEFITPGTYKNKLQFELHHGRYQKITTKFKGRKGELVDRTAMVLAGYKEENLQELQDRLYAQARRVEKSSLNLPPMTEVDLNIDLDPAHLTAYRKLIKEKLLFLDDGAIIDATATATLRSLAMRAVAHPKEVGLGSVDNMMLEAVDELLDEVGVEYENKVFIVAHHQASIEQLRDRYERYNPAVIYGKTKDAGAEAERFKTDNTCRILIAQYVAGGVGLNLQDNCCIGIAYEPTTVPGVWEQVIARIWRGGQRKNVTFYRLIPRGTLFVKCWDDLKVKTDTIVNFMDRRALESSLLGGDI